MGSALTGPGGEAVGKLIATKFGGRLDEPEALQALIHEDPEVHRKLKQVEMDHEVALQHLILQSAIHAWQMHRPLWAWFPVL